MDYNKYVNTTAAGIKPSGIRKFFDISDTMEGVISLGVGEPDFRTPWHIRNAGISSLENGQTRYTSNWGMEALRTEICRFMKRKYNLSYDPHDEVLVTVGGSEAIDIAVRTIIRPGDEVLIPQPSFVCYEPIVQLAGGTPVIIELKDEDNFVLKPEQIKEKVTEKTKAIVLPYPCNPTGAIMTTEDLLAIKDVIIKNDLLIISDEIYAELTFGEHRHVSVAEIEGLSERTILVSGFSKTYSMTGWRLGFACGPAPLLALMTKLHQYAIMCAPTTAQYAAIEALKNGDDDVAEMREQYNQRRRYLLHAFAEMGLPCFEPDGAFYVFPCIKEFGMTSDEFATRFLQEEKVAVVPGTAFGDSGEGYIRISYAYSLENLKVAIGRLSHFVKKLKAEKE